MSNILTQLAGVIASAGNNYLAQLGAANTLNNAGATNPTFSGWDNFPQPVKPTPMSIGLAQQLLTGSLPANPIGNAVVFGVPSMLPPVAGQNSSAWQGLVKNGLNVGGAFFSDISGPPTPSFSAVANGSAGA